MKIPLTTEQKIHLEEQHRAEHDGCIRVGSRYRLM